MREQIYGGNRDGGRKQGCKLPLLGQARDETWNLGDLNALGTRAWVEWIWMVCRWPDHCEQFSEFADTALLRHGVDDREIQSRYPCMNRQTEHTRKEVEKKVERA